jgi:hypothetical protein
MLIKDKFDFQPSTESLEKWLSTRKSSINVGGVPMPQSTFSSDDFEPSGGLTKRLVKSRNHT